MTDPILIQASELALAAIVAIILLMRERRAIVLRAARSVGWHDPENWK